MISKKVKRICQHCLFSKSLFRLKKAILLYVAQQIPENEIDYLKKVTLNNTIQ